MNLLDIAKRNNNDTEIGVIEDVINNYAALKVLDTKVIKGTYFDTFRRTSVPHGSFVHLNEGITADNSDGEQVRVECYGYEDRVEIAKRAVLANDGSLGDLLADECAAHFEGNCFYMEKQIFDGVENDPKGFAGLKTNVLDELTIDAGSSTAKKRTSVYMLFTGRTGVRFVCGKESALKIGEPREETLRDKDGKPYEGHVAPMTGWYGLMIGNSRSVGRIANIDASNPITQKLMGKLLAKFPTNVRPNAIFMNRSAGEMWLDDRSKVAALKSGSTSLNLNGLHENALVDSYMGVPIYFTDAIGNAE